MTSAPQTTLTTGMKLYDNTHEMRVSYIFLKVKELTGVIMKRPDKVISRGRGEIILSEIIYFA